MRQRTAALDIVTFFVEYMYNINIPILVHKYRAEHVCYLRRNTILDHDITAVTETNGMGGHSYGIL